MTGIAGCCARAASGHAAEPPRSQMNSRRRIYRLQDQVRYGRSGRYHIDPLMPCDAVLDAMFDPMAEIRLAA
jgi:hypothetical protein